jgi:hypothetical protein
MRTGVHFARKRFDASKIRGDALGLPIAIARRFRTFRALELLLARCGVGFGGFSSRLGFGERALRCRRKWLSCCSGRRRKIIGHRALSITDSYLWQDLLQDLSNVTFMPRGIQDAHNVHS